MTNMEGTEKEALKGSSSQPSQPLFDSSPVAHQVTLTNADLMKKLCVNGLQTERLSQAVEDLRGMLLSLRLDNDALKKEIEASKQRQKTLRWPWPNTVLL